MALFAIFMISGILAISTTVLGQPRIQAFNFPTNVVVGQKASATCTAISGRSPLEFRWLKNGKEISPGGPITVRTLMDVSVLVIESVDASSSGNYTCFLNTAMGTDSYTAPLDVKEPSKWVNNIQDHDLKNGDNTTVLCKAEGMPLPQVKWVKKAEIDLEATTSVENQQSLPGSSRLILLNSKPEDSGYYFCIANNNVGKPISRAIYINVLD